MSTTVVGNSVVDGAAVHGAVEFEVTRNPHPTSAEARAEILKDPGFGVHFTDHMVTVDWSAAEGWHDAKVVPYGPLQIDPAAAVLHYAQEIFEGLKAYRHADGTIATFRPDENAKRFQLSARRLALPELPSEIFIESLKQIIAVDADWVPDGVGETSLYLRPFLIGTEAFLGVDSAKEVKYVLIASPAGPYFAGGVKPVDIWLSEDYSRAALGGTGEAKCGGNYAASLEPQQEAYEHGCKQVLFLDAETHTTVDELGGMNIMFVFANGELVTPTLSGSILRGITRKSILALAKSRGLTPVERSVTIAEWREGVVNGSIREVFACGTAAVITPLAELRAKSFTIPAAPDTAGPVTMGLRETLTNIQYGRADDTFGWVVPLNS